MENTQKKFIIDVVPLANIARSKAPFFSYLHHEEIPTGTLVSVPFFRRNLDGIVVASRTDFHRLGNFTLKKVGRILEPNMLTMQQLTLARWMSDYYLAPLGIILKHFVPKKVQSRIRTSTSIHERTVAKNITLTNSQLSTVSFLSEAAKKNPGSEPKKILLSGPSSSGKTDVCLQAMKNIADASKNSQFLVLQPELTLVPHFLKRCREFFTEDQIAVFHSKISKGQFWDNWQDVRSGKARVVIGTRIALFAPFLDLAMVVVDEEQDTSYKQWDQGPRYDARDVAEVLAVDHGAPVVFASATPRVETYYRAGMEELYLLELPDLVADKRKVEVVDMRKEKWTDFAGKKKPNYSFLSRTLQNSLADCLRFGHQAVLFLNHQGMSAFSVCTTCKSVLRCPKCQRALVYDESGVYKCLHCKYETGVFAKCANCSAMEFKNVGLGTQAVEREIRKLFPSARILRADRSTTKKALSQDGMFDSFSAGEFDILIGTQMITKGWDFPNVSLAAVIDADSSASIPDFTTDQQRFQHLMQLGGRTGRYSSRIKGEFVIQTYRPDDPVIKAVSARDSASFYAKQLEERRALCYPPFAGLMKILFKHEDLQKATKEASLAYQKLHQGLQDYPHIRIYPPQSPLVSKVRGKHLLQILIKNKHPQRTLPESIENIIRGLGTGWVVDRDPISIV